MNINKYAGLDVQRGAHLRLCICMFTYTCMQIDNHKSVTFFDLEIIKVNLTGDVLFVY